MAHSDQIIPPGYHQYAVRRSYDSAVNALEDSAASGEIGNYEFDKAKIIAFKSQNGKRYWVVALPHF